MHHNFRLPGALALTVATWLGPWAVPVLACPAQDAPAPQASDTLRISGVVRDRSGAIVPTGWVQLRGRDSAVQRSTPTDGAGRFAFEGLAAGRYLVAAAAPGFAPSERQVTLPATDETAAIDVTLDVEQQAMVVEVTASAARPLIIETDPRAPRQPIPAQDGADYLKTVPGFSVIRKGGTDGDPVLRGMAGSRLGVLLDGQAILGGCGNRMDPPTAYVFPAAYDRITVLKGPQTVVHGPGNSAGVVLFDRTPTRYDRPAFQVFASPVVGSWGRNDELGSVEVGASRGYFSVSANRSAMDDYEDGHGESVHAGYERWSANGTVGWTPDGSTRIEVLGALGDGEAAYADRAMDGVAFTRQNVGLRVERQHITSILQALEGQAFYNYVDHVMDNYSLRTFVPSMTMPFPAVSNPDRRTVGARANADLQLASRTTATLGADWQGNRHTIRSSSNEPRDPYDTHPRTLDAEFENAGAFGEVTQAVGRTGRVVAGARVDWWTGTDERSTVRIGMGAAAVQVPNPTAGERRREVLPSGFGRYEHAFGAGSSTFYAGVGHVARAPDYWELVSKESAASVSAFDTVPERTTQIDAGVLYRRGAVSGSVSGFANTVSDYILIESNFVKSSTSASGMTVQRKATVTRSIDASSWGGEATLAWEAVRRFTVETSLAFVRGQNDTDDLPLAQQPPLEGRVALQYAADRWSLAALARLVAAQDRYALNQGNIVGQDLGPAPGFAVLSLNGSWRLARYTRLSAGVDNLLDTTYAEFISRGGANVPGFTTTTRVNEPGRTWWIKVDMRN